jgi:hypothetical protein
LERRSPPLRFGHAHSEYFLGWPLLFFAGLALWTLGAVTRAADDEALWRDFTQVLRDGKVTEERIHPYVEALRPIMRQFLDSLRAQAKPEDWEAKPEIHRAGHQIHFLVPLTGGDGNKTTYCFTLVETDRTWFFQHLESIFIRLDRLGPLPVSTFPDLPEAQTTWMREENAVTDRLRFYTFLVAEKGKAAALDWFQRESDGYFLAARTWVPFVAPSRAFVLYLCWEQSKLRGSPTTLTALDDAHAVVVIDAIDLRLYRQTAHLRHLIAEPEFREFSETLWRQRATAAGWNVEFAYDGTKRTLEFRRLPGPAHP